VSLSLSARWLAGELLPCRSATGSASLHPPPPPPPPPTADYPTHILIEARVLQEVGGCLRMLVAMRRSDECQRGAGRRQGDVISLSQPRETVSDLASSLPVSLLRSVRWLQAVRLCPKPPVVDRQVIHPITCQGFLWKVPAPFSNTLIQ